MRRKGEGVDGFRVVMVPETCEGSETEKITKKKWMSEDLGKKADDEYVRLFMIMEISAVNRCNK